jgi:hypothetical protein
VIAVGDVDDLLAVAAPYRIDLVIEGAVVVARQIASVFACQALHIREFAVADIGRENVEPFVVTRGHEYDALSVGGKSRLDIDSTIRQERLGGTTGQVQYP